MKRKINFSILFKIIAHLKYLPVIIFRIKNWFAFIINYIGLRNGEFECIFRDGIKINVPDSIGVATLAVIFIKKEYGDVPNNSIIIDIGANVGLYTIFAVRGNGNTVYAFEPMPDNFKLLNKNIKKNKLEEKIISFNFAIAGKREKRDLYLADHLSHSLFPVNGVRQEHANIDCITLEDIFVNNKIEKCDMLKMDCEGAEFEILYGLRDSYFSKINNIKMEYHNFETKKSYNGKNLAKYIKDKGFNIEKLIQITHHTGFLWTSRI